MKTIISAIAIASSITVALLWNGAALARTPTPTAPPTVTATPSPTPFPTPTPTLPPEQVAKFSGQAWLDAFGGYDNIGSVTAKIGDTVCGQSFFLCDFPPCLHIPIDPPPEMLPYGLDVLPAEVRPGCGQEGSPVTFFVGDKQAKQTAVWHAGTSQEVNLFDIPFAEFHGDVTLPPGLDPSLFEYGPLGMYAYVNGNLCGEVGPGGIWRDFPYEEVVKSAEEQPGCGVEGAEVTFKLHDRQGNIMGVARNIIGVAREKGVWHAWGNGNTGQGLNLTMDPVSGIGLANVGDGASRNSDSALRVELSLGLSALGLLGIATAAALRRRATTR